MLKVDYLEDVVKVIAAIMNWLSLEPMFVRYVFNANFYLLADYQNLRVYFLVGLIPSF